MKKWENIVSFCTAFGLGLISFKIPSSTWKEHGPDVGVALIFVPMLIATLTPSPRNRDGSRSTTAALGLLAGWLYILGGVGIIVFGAFERSMAGISMGLIVLGMGAAFTVPTYYVERRHRSEVPPVSKINDH